MNLKEDLFSADTPRFEPLAAESARGRWMRSLARSTCWARSATSAGDRIGRELHSFLLWGPPGVGKTTLARLVSSHHDAQFLQISAVLSGVKEIRLAIEQARDAALRGRRTVLFVDEVHRFNKVSRMPSCRTLRTAPCYFMSDNDRTPPLRSTVRCCPG